MNLCSNNSKLSSVAQVWSKSFFISSRIGKEEESERKTTSHETFFPSILLLGLPRTNILAMYINPARISVQKKTGKKPLEFNIIRKVLGDAHSIVNITCCWVTVA